MRENSAKQVTEEREAQRPHFSCVRTEPFCARPAFQWCASWLICILLCLPLFLNGCATRPETNKGTIVGIPNGTTVIFKHQYIFFAPGTNSYDAVLMNGVRCRRSRDKLGAWVKLEYGVNQIVVTGLKDGKTSLLDSTTIIYEPDEELGSESDAYSPFEDPDGDGVVNEIDKKPMDGRWSLDTDGDGLVENFHTNDTEKVKNTLSISIGHGNLDGQIIYVH